MERPPVEELLLLLLLVPVLPDPPPPPDALPPLPSEDAPETGPLVAPLVAPLLAVTGREVAGGNEVPPVVPDPFPDEVPTLELPTSWLEPTTPEAPASTVVPRTQVFSTQVWVGAQSWLVSQR